MNKTFEKIYSENNVILNKDMALKENTALFEKVYAEAEMLNEMNPKLRALLAAGLIGTAGLGATSCSTPNDDYEEPTAIEQPATPETPGSTTETPAEPETEDTKETNTAEETTDTTFKAFELEVTPEQAKSLARAIKKETVSEFKDNSSKGVIDLIYKDGQFNKPSFIDGVYKDGNYYTVYLDKANKTNITLFYIPVGATEGAFDSAIAAYNAIHNK